MTIEHEMQSAVDAICESLRNEPHKWKIDTYTCEHKEGKFGGKVFWTSGYDSFFNVWSGRNHFNVFTEEQKVKLAKAYTDAILTVGNKFQQELKDSLKPEVPVQPADDTPSFEAALRQLLKAHHVRNVNKHDPFFGHSTLEFHFHGKPNLVLRLDKLLR